MSKLLLTGSQTVGPFFSPTLLREDAVRNVLTQPETVGERIRIETPGGGGWGARGWVTAGPSWRRGW